MEEKRLLYKDRPEWSDVTPIKQDDGEHPVASILYTPECLFKYLVLFSSF